ncbi:ABC transporter permease [Rhodobacter sp. KR11]|uniref:ABC transporter permease n=1 Tax=Rhodobacter sp. KR11 TaxID=2974588 RepID=UPI0022224C3D|nr:ABC transporter permease [Rhodobacter sp. KR11]MCW1919327.1 ABC transporter permease [Rhodobacter sp. KR11]
MRTAAPVLAVIGLILVLWYGATVWLNAAWTYDQAARDGTEVTFATLVSDTMAQERPVLPPPHQVAAELWKGLTAYAPTSKKSLVYHGLVTLTSTFWGFVFGTLLGSLMAVVIVRSRVAEMGLMPWAVISQTIPVVAIAPMIVVLSNTLGFGERLGVENQLVSKTIIAAYLSYFPVLVGMVKGLRAPDQMQLDLLKTWGASDLQTFRLLRLPSSMPYLFASLKVGIAASLVGAIVGELPTGAIEGLGARMLIGSQFGSPIVVWSALFAAAILAGGLILILRAAETAINKRMGGRT